MPPHWHSQHVTREHWHEDPKTNTNKVVGNLLLVSYLGTSPWWPLDNAACQQSQIVCSAGVEAQMSQNTSIEEV